MDKQQTSIFPFQNTFSRLPERFFAKVNPSPVAAPKLLCLNTGLAAQLGLDAALLSSTAGVEVLSGNTIAQGSEPLAAAYAGHQFGYFVPQLGDGRANLLGEVVDAHGRRFDIQLKGAGRTPFSRGGDGRAALGPVLREYILSEAMAALGVPTTRALAAVATGEPVLRETPLAGAVLTRVAASHLRVGTFQYFAVREDIEALRILADYAVGRHYPEIAGSEAKYLDLLRGVIGRQATLVAQWMLVGFIHGVMNTDNTSISGETIDYGPCAFLEAYDPEQVFSSIDRQGRYAYSNQPFAMHWNLVRLAETLLPLIAAETGNDERALELAKGALESFMPQFEGKRLAGFRRKLGLFTVEADDAALIEDWLALMAANEADFTLTFRRLSDAAAAPEQGEAVVSCFSRREVYASWAAQWRERLSHEPQSPAVRSAAMKSVNPAFIPRNHRVQEVIEAAYGDNLQPLEELLDVVAHPFDDRPERREYTEPALAEQRVLQTFCGT